MALLSLCDLSKSYRQGGAWGSKKEIRAVSGVSLELEAGRCLAVVGPSGSGKSTLGRMALGLERPDAGAVLYKGEPLVSLGGERARQARRNMQVVFQNSHGAGNPRFTVKDIIGEPLRNFRALRGKSLEDAAAASLSLVGLEADMLSKLPHQLSGGELQRVCIARAFAPNPELVVLDEAVSSLDMLNQSLILDLLTLIKEEKATALLFISHDLRVVGKIADAVAVMEDGRLAAYAPDIADPAVLAGLLEAPAMRDLVSAVPPPMPIG